MSIAEEFRQHLPGFLARFKGRPAADVEILTAWAFAVEGWGYGSWLKQQNYERLYSQHHNPMGFLDGLTHLLTLLDPYLLSETAAKALFEGRKDVDLLTAIVRAQAGKETVQASDPPLDVRKAWLSTRTGANGLRKWIAQRRQAAHLQLLEVLRTIQFVESDELDKWELPQLTVPLLSEKDWQEYLAMLVRQFEYAPRPSDGELRWLLSQLRELVDLPLGRVLDHEQESQMGTFHLAKLTERYPNWRFPGLDDRHVIHAHSLTPQLWQELVWAFIQRMKGAWRFHNQVADLLDKPPAPYPFSSHAPAPVAAPAPGAAGAAKLRLRQVALLHIYGGKGLTRPKANDAATKAGYTSRTSGQQLMQHYNALAHHVTNRIGVEGKALTDMINDITAILPALIGTALQQAENELQTLRAKK